MKETGISEIIKSKHASPAFRYIFFNSDSVIKELTFGNQNIEHNIPVNDSTSFHAFSTTKLFTAVAIMQLVEKGLIQLDDTISNYLPEYQFSSPITVRNLLCHQSGLACPLPLKWVHLAAFHDDFNYTAFADSIVQSNLKLKRSPGKKYAYSNIDYLVLGRLIEVLSGEDYRSFISYNILYQLNTEAYIGFDIPKQNHATGYHPNSLLQNLLLGILLDKKKLTYKASKEWTGFRLFYVNGAAYGGIICDPSALMRFCQDLLSDSSTLLSPESIKKMLTPAKTSKGKTTKMAMGWFHGKLQGCDYFCHAGGGGGYYAEVRIYPALRLGSVIMLNSSGMKDERILNLLDVKYLPRLPIKALTQA